MDLYFKKGHITTDRFFTSLKLAERLKTNKPCRINRVRKDYPETLKAPQSHLYKTTILRVERILPYIGERMFWF